MRLYQEQRDILPLENNTKEGSKFLNRSIVRVPQVVEEYTDLQLGGLAKTGNPLDVALAQPNTFYAVSTPAGVRYTRDGSFKVNEQGTLVNSEGHPVLSRGGETITLPEDQRITVDSEGNIYGKSETTLTQDVLVGQLQVARFENPKWLEKVGNNLYTTDQVPVLAEGTNFTAQGFIEKSNVNAVSEMTALIETNRLVGMYQKVMDTHMNDMNEQAISKLGSISA